MVYILGIIGIITMFGTIYYLEKKGIKNPRKRRLTIINETNNSRNITKKGNNKNDKATSSKNKKKINTDKSIVITSGKAGVGKTTITFNLGAALAMMGKRVCLINADIGPRNLNEVMGLENRIVYDIVDVVEKKCRLEQGLIRDKRFNNLFLLPATQARDEISVTPHQMKELVAALKKDMDYVVVDSPAGIEQGFKNAIAGADRAIIVTTPKISAVRDADRIIGLLESEGLKYPRVIINRINIDMIRKGNMMDIDDMIEILAIDLLGVVPEDERIVKGMINKEPVTLNIESRIGKAFVNIARRIEGEEVEIMCLEKNKITDKLNKMFNISS